MGMTYRESIVAAMKHLGEQPDTLFIGQTVVAGGSYMGATLEAVPESKRIEWPVAEEMQLGASLGIALADNICVISLFPRMDFLLLAINQLVNHVDKIGVMSEGRMNPRLIIRTSIGPKKPLDGGPQHTGNYTNAIREMLTTIKVCEISTPKLATELYQRAYDERGTWLMIEDGSKY